MKTIISFFFILFLVFTSQSTSASEPIKIGVIAAKSGAAANNHRRIFLSARLAVEQINLKGGVLGKQIELIELDNKTTSLGSKITAQKAVSENVTAVIGCVRSSNSLAAGPVLQKAKTIMISPISTNPKVTLIGDYVFRVCFLDSLQGQIMANFAIKELRCQSASKNDPLSAPNFDPSKVKKNIIFCSLISNYHSLFL